MRISYKGGEVQDEISGAVRGNHQMWSPWEAKSVVAITVKEAWAVLSILLDYPEENGLKWGEQEGHSIERHAD
jgi:hypothetical protein